MIHTNPLPGLENATLIERDQHTVSRSNISPSALKVLYKLTDGGFHAYLVGGGVRDLLLGLQPKDFDITTNATPEELRKLFRNARIIGRRFKIVHIRYGREIIEVTTFRAHHDAQNQIADDASRRQIKGLDSAHSSTGMILRDNVYGDINEDALRRDFTVNALYYTLNNFQVLDFSGGMDDLRSKKIRMIGDPSARYREDPVRMLRAIRFSAKLGFTIEASTRHPINELAHLLESISPARLFDETLKLFTNGHAEVTFGLLREFEVGKYLFGPTLAALEDAGDCERTLVDLALRNTDNRLAEGKSVTPYFLFAALLWPVLQQRLQAAASAEGSEYQRFQQAANATLREQLDFTAIPKRFTLAAKEIWELQLRIEKHNRRSIESTFNHPRFRAAYDFLLLREEAGEELNMLGQWWTDFQIADTDQRAEITGAVEQSGSKRRRRRKRKPSGNTE
jgi:poly(A) polymerase